MIALMIIRLKITVHPTSAPNDILGRGGKKIGKCHEKIEMGKGRKISKCGQNIFFRLSSFNR